MYFRTLLTVILLLATSASYAQSGRKKKTPAEDAKKDPKQEIVYQPTQKTAQNTPGGKSPKPTPPPLTNPDKDIIVIESNLVPIPVSVIDRVTGRALTNLALSDFELQIDDKSAAIAEVFRSDTPVRLALLFDNSSSVSIARDFEQKAAIRFLKRVIRPEKDLAALYSVAGITQLEQPLTKDVSALIRAIKSFAKPRGATALHDGIIEASNYLKDFAGRHIIVIVSDGQDTLSNSSFDQMVKAVQINNCQVYIVNTDEFENFQRTGNRAGSANIRALAAERRMKTLASETGGAVYSPIDEDELDSAFRKISVELSEQYVLAYYPEKDVRGGRFHSIDLRVRSASTLDVKSRKGYYEKKY